MADQQFTSMRLDHLRPAITIRSIAYREQPLSYSVAAHARGGYQWYCVIHGSVDQTVDGTVHRLGPYESVLIPPDAIRSPSCRDEAPGYFWVCFDNETLSLDPITACTLTPPPELRSDIRELARELGASPGTNTDELVHSLVVRCLVGLIRAYAPETAEDGSSPAGASAHVRERVARVEAFMRRNLHRPLTREDCAEIAHLSVAQLGRVFRAATGKTVLARLTELRMSMARELLADSTMPVTEVALEIGYNSFSHFSSTFRKLMGTTPSEYRSSCNPAAG